MANFTTLQEMAWLGTKLKNGSATPGDRQRFETLLEREVQYRLARQMPAIEAEARRRTEAREAGRRAGLAAGRRVFAQLQQRNRRW